MPVPPPYTYDDPRLAYGEHCFLWNGGYDEVCLVIGFDRKRRVGVGGGAGKSSQPQPPSLPWIDITVCAQLISANEETLEWCERVTQGARGELAPGAISLLASRTDSEESSVRYLAEPISTDRARLDSPEVDVTADPLLATQAGKTIPLANLRPKASSIIFRTEVTSSNKTTEKNIPPKVVETEEVPANIAISATFLSTNKKPPTQES